MCECKRGSTCVLRGLTGRDRKRATAMCKICTWRGSCCTSGGIGKRQVGRIRFGPTLAHQSIMKNEQGPLSPSLEILIEHRRHKKSSWKHLRTTRLLVILSSPLIYACVLPFLLVDASVELYQLVCFPIYGIPRVRRKDYL